MVWEEHHPANGGVNFLILTGTLSIRWKKGKIMGGIDLIAVSVSLRMHAWAFHMYVHGALYVYINKFVLAPHCMWHSLCFNLLRHLFAHRGRHITRDTGFMHFFYFFCYIYIYNIFSLV